MRLDTVHLRKSRDVLREPLESLIARARKTGRRTYLAARWRIDARDLLSDFLTARTDDSFFWQEPSRGISLLGLGRIATIEAQGPERFQHASGRSSELFDACELVSLTDSGEIDRSTPSTDWRGPLLVGGFGFYEKETAPESEWRALGSGRLLLPELSVACRGDEAWVTRTCAVRSDDTVAGLLDALGFELYATRTHSKYELDAKLVHCDLGPSLGESARGPEIRVQADRTHGRYLAQVEAALEAIEAGKFEKVVLARSLTVAADEDFDLPVFLRSLREVYPACATVAIREGEHLFVSATPERLVALDGDTVRTAALAGSAPRGRSPEEEARHSDELLSSDKEHKEHEVVKRSIRAALADVCGELDGASAPTLLKLEGIQHLETRFAGHLKNPLRDDTNVLDLVGRLHPTPAVGGAPSSAALDWLERFEDLDRGWYAGPIGYLDASGNGEFRVALRSALLRGRRARLFAGAGIVAGSDPQCELAETRLKLRALLAPLTEI